MAPAWIVETKKKGRCIVTRAPKDPLAKPITLASGSHHNLAAGVCAMEAVAWLANEPFSDKPACTDPAIASFVRQINDRMPDNATRDKFLLPILPRLIGTAYACEVTSCS